MADIELAVFWLKFRELQSARASRKLVSMATTGRVDSGHEMSCTRAPDNGLWLTREIVGGE